MEEASTTQPQKQQQQQQQEEEINDNNKDDDKHEDKHEDEHEHEDESEEYEKDDEHDEEDANNDNNHHIVQDHSNNSNRCQYVVQTSTTELQCETEDEVSDYLINIKKLPKYQLKHLRKVGLLPPLSSSVSEAWKEVELALEGENDDGEGGAGAGGGGGGGREEEERDDNDDNDNDNNDNENPFQYDVCLLRTKHIQYLTNALEHTLPRPFLSLDASRTWMIYWTLHGLDLLNALPKLDTLEGIVDIIRRCFTRCSGVFVGQSGGGFGGGPGQIGHCATTYAAIMALCIIAGGEGQSTADDSPINSDLSQLALRVLDRVRVPLYKWFYSLRCTTYLARGRTRRRRRKRRGGKEEEECDDGNGDGDGERKVTGFRVHHDGEVDVRGTYTVVAVATLLNIVTNELVDGVAEYVAACQTYEGGFSGAPHEGEAHGGYTYCALATLKLLNQITTTNNKILDLNNLRGWLSRRQMPFEGGFSGRSNKLVDGCYSFWQGASIAILDLSFIETTSSSSSSSSSAAEAFVESKKMGNWEGGGFCREEEEEDEGMIGKDPSDDDIINDNDDDIIENNQNNFESNSSGVVVDLDHVIKLDDDDSNDQDDNHHHSSCSNNGGLTFDQGKLQRYILMCAQEINGGLRDKPSKPRDFYHSCYNLSGLSISQHVLSDDDDDDDDCGGIPIPVVYGYYKNVVNKTHVIFNIRYEKVWKIVNYFKNRYGNNVVRGAAGGSGSSHDKLMET